MISDTGEYYFREGTLKIRVQGNIFLDKNRGIFLQQITRKRAILPLRGDVKKNKNSIFKEIVQIGGGEVNPMSKIGKEMNF